MEFIVITLILTLTLTLILVFTLNQRGYKTLNKDYKDFLLSLGWPVNLKTHAGWAGVPRAPVSARNVSQEQTGTVTNVIYQLRDAMLVPWQEVVT